MPHSPQNDLDVYKLSAQLTIINRDNIRSIGEVEGKIEQLRYEVKKTRRELNSLTLKLDNLKALANQAEEYFALMDKAERTPTEELRLKMYKPVLESNNITSRWDFEYLKSIIADTEPKAAPLKENFEKCADCMTYTRRFLKPTTRFLKGIISRGLLRKSERLYKTSIAKATSITSCNLITHLPRNKTNGFLPISTEAICFFVEAEIWKCH